MFILAVDPGQSTGLVLAEIWPNSDAPQQAWIHKLETYEDFSGLDDPLMAILDDYQPKICIIEAGPPAGDPSQLWRVNTVEDIAEWCVEGIEIVKLGPGMWKPVAKAQGFNNHPAAKTQHERDAYAMFHHWLTQKCQKKLKLLKMRKET